MSFLLPSPTFWWLPEGQPPGQWLGTQQYGYIVPDAGQGVKRQIFVDASVLPPYLSAPAPVGTVPCAWVSILDVTEGSTDNYCEI